MLERSMRVVGVIPSRYGSERLPGKALQKIHGRALLEWVVLGVKESSSLDQIFVATDNDLIANLAEKLGVQPVMTSTDISSGTDRVWDAVKDKDFDVVLNIQGDEPLVKPLWVDSLVQLFQGESDIEMATLAHKLEKNGLENKNSVKVVLDNNDDALYFSRYPVPFSKTPFHNDQRSCFQHMGLYAYTKKFLKTFCEQGPVELEKCESLEQLRALWLGCKIRVKVIDALSVGVDTPEDARRVEEILRKRD